MELASCYLDLSLHTEAKSVLQTALQHYAPREVARSGDRKKSQLLAQAYVMHYAGEVPDNKGIVTLLVQYGALDAHVRPADDLSRQFLAAVFLADASRVQALLSRHPHLATAFDGRGNQPIHHAARNGDTKIVRLLIEHGAGANAATEGGQTALFCAGGHGHLDTLQLLLDAGADCDAELSVDGQTLLLWLAQFPEDTGFVPIVEALQRHKAGK